MKYFLNNIFSSRLFIIIYIFVLFLFVCILNIFIYFKLNNKISSINCSRNNISYNLYKENDTILDNTTVEEKGLFVDIKGEVLKPGVYEVVSGTRVSDLIKLAGGITKKGNTRFINLSKKLYDGDVIVIYSNDEIKKAQKSNTIVVQTPCVCEEVKNDACLVENLNIEEPINETKNETIVNNSKININTATKEELMSLSGIGEAKAISIIEYRESNGPFKDIKDITNVKGISESIYVKIKENITI